MLHLLVFDLLLMESLAKLLNFTPLIIANIGWHVFNFNHPNIIWQLAKRGLVGGTADAIVAEEQVFGGAQHLPLFLLIG